jgi:sugar phosphate isomerase/epimerase
VQIGASTMGFLYRATLGEALAAIGRIGYRSVELACTAPHLDVSRATTLERLDVRRTLARAGVVAASVNPVDVNLLHPNHGFAEAAHRQVRGAIELAHDLEAPLVVFSPGRRHPLFPAPLEDAYEALRRQIERVLPDAERLGVGLAVETVPFGLMQTGAEARSFVTDYDSLLGVAYDPANTIAFEEGGDGIRDTGDRLRIVHVSGSWRDRWAHTGIREGDVDHGDVAQALREIDFAGPTIYELADGEDPEPRLRDDVPLLGELGWRLEARHVRNGSR